jgi:ribose 5-phosphate isomerase A
MSIETAKRAAALAAAALIQDRQIVGLGSGSTARLFIEALAERCRNGLTIQAVASSQNSADLAEQLGIPLIALNEAPYVDLVVDGADEIDPLKRMIKGGGGAHVREKILAAAAREMIVIVDETKLVPALGKHKLPVEILTYGAPSTRAKIEHLGYRGSWRLQRDGSFFTTDNHNFLFDIQFEDLLHNPEEHHEKISKIPGVVDTGFFFHLAGRVIVGTFDGALRPFSV